MRGKFVKHECQKFKSADSGDYTDCHGLPPGASPAVGGGLDGATVVPAVVFAA